MSYPPWPDWTAEQWREAASVQKFDPAEHPREPGGTPIGGRFAESGHSAAAASSDPALVTQADSGIAAVEKLIPEAVKTADYRRDVNPEKWDDVDQDTKNRVYDDWQESQMGNFYADTSELDKEVKKEVEDDNQKILDLAVDDTVTGVSKLFPDTAPVLDTGDPQAPPFQLYRKLDPDSIDYGYGEHDHNDNVPIDLEALKFTSGESLTPEEQQRVKTNWDTFYEKAFQNTLSEVYESDNYIERRQSLDDDALSDAWGEMSDEDKFNWLMSHPRLTKGGKLSQGEPKDWVTGVKEGSRNDEDYVRTRAVALRLTELRTDEIRKERGLLDPKEQTLPHYYITNDSILPDAKAGIGGVVSFEVSDDAGRTVAHASSSEEAKTLGDAWAAKEAKQRAERSVTPSKEIIQHVWEAWKDKSSEGVGLSLQLAAAKEFGGYHRMTPDEVQAATEYVDDDFGGIPTMQAYVRAQWEVTQMIMKKAQESKVDVYRAIMLPGEKVNKAQNLPVDKYGGNYAPPTNIRSSTTSALPAPDQRAYVAFDFAGEHFSVVKQQWDDGRVETDEAAINRRVTKFYADKKWDRNTAPDLYLKLPDLQIQRAGAQSTTGTLKVANDWQGVGNLPDEPTRVVLRIEAPSTSVLSLPVYGKNIIGEHESVLMGTKDKWLWDAWRDKAPDFSSAKLAHKAEYEPLIVDLQAEDRGKPHWMTGVDWAVQKWEASQHPRDPKGEFTDKAAATLDAVDDLPVSPEIQELEEAWVGGVADFGDARAAEAIQNVEGYEEYRQSIADTLRKHLGDSITAYRSMSPNEYEDWTQGGGPQGLVGVTLDPEVAKHWEKFALNTEPRTVASFQIDPAHVVMRGSRNESEIVVDADWIEQKQLKAVKKWNESEPRDAQGRWTKSTYVPQHEVSEKGTWDWTGVDRNAMVGPGPKWVQQHRELVREALFAWLGDPGALRIHAQDAMVGAPPPDSGSGKERRAQAEALLWELEHNSKPIPMPLYRGSGPKGDRQNSQYSWSEDRDIAKTFAKRYGGTVQVLPAGTARGLRVRDYVGGMIEEKQWIVRAGNNPLTKKYDIPPKKQSVAKGEHDYGNTHIMIDPWSAAASSLNTARNLIRDEDRMGVGKDVDPNHITVRYGLLNEDLDTLRTFIAHQQAFEAQVIGIELFPPSEYSEGAVPVVARISSPELHAVEAEIGKYADFKEKSFPVYKPHCTLAYVSPDAAPQYADLPVYGNCLVHSITISHASGVQETIPFGMTKKWDEILHPRDQEGKFTEREAFVQAAIQRGEAHLVSEKEFLSYHFTGQVPSDAYEKYEAGDMNFIHRKDFDTLLSTHQVGDETVELRVQAEPTRYAKQTVAASEAERNRLFEEYEQAAKKLGTSVMSSSIDLGRDSEAYKSLKEYEQRWRQSGSEYVRDEHGDLVYLTPEEIKAQGLSPTTYTVGAFVGDKAVGYAGDEFGASGVYMARGYQHHGLGLALLKTYLEKSGRLAKGRQIGQMTNAGENVVRALHRQLVKEAKAQKRQGKLWDESQHPRHPGGSSQGGEFESAPRDALQSILNGERASIDPGDLRKFMEMARDQPEDPNLLHLHVDGFKVFDQTGLGIKREDMPQIPREHRENFLKEMKEAGVKIEKQWVDPLSLAPSQDEISARNAGEKLLKYETKDKDFPPLLVSQEGRVLDGHHHWAMMAALAIDAPQVKVPIYRLHVHVRQALAMMKAYDRKYHIKRKSLTTKADPVSGRYVTPFVSFDKQGDDQLRMIASLNSSRLATWGFTAEAEVRGLARYRITAVLDGRTSEFCRFIDGKIFETTDAREKVIEALNVQNPDDLRTVQPWPKQTKAAMADFREMSNDDLVERGLQIPPYHPYCRTLLRPVTSSSDELDAEDIVATIPEDVETFQPVTLADLQELGIDATQEDVDQWNTHVGMSPVELLSKLSGMEPRDVMTEGVGSNPVGFDEDGNIAFNSRGEVNGVEFKLGALLDPFTGIYYLTQADLATGTPSAEAAFLKKMFSALIDMGESSPTATAIAVGVAGNAAYYAKLGFLPDEIEWDTIRQYALDELETSLQPMLESLAPEDQELVRHLLQDSSVGALSALVDLPFEYEGKTIGEWILEETSGTWELDLTDDAIIEQAKAYLS